LTTANTNSAIETTGESSKTGYNRFLLLVAGLGGLLYGVDVGMIAGALPYLEATFKDAATGQSLTGGQESHIVAAVLLGSVISTLFAGLLADTGIMWPTSTTHASVSWWQTNLRTSSNTPLLLLRDFRRT
jgi:MFS family permease